MLYTLSNRKLLPLLPLTNQTDCEHICVAFVFVCMSGHEEQLIPYSLVQMIHVSSKRPVIFSPSVLSRSIIERLLQPAESALDFDTCQPGMTPPTAFITPLMIHTLQER